MPIYEFYCPDCHTLFSFFSARFAPDAAPSCPRCARPGLGAPPLPVRDAAAQRRSDEAAEPDDLFAGLDESRLEGAMEQLAGEIGDLDAEGPQDPRQVSRFLRRFADLTGLEAGPKLQEMLTRLDRGEDPDALEQEMGGGEGDEDLAELFRTQARRARPPPAPAEGRRDALLPLTPAGARLRPVRPRPRRWCCRSRSPRRRGPAGRARCGSSRSCSGSGASARA